MQFSFSKTYNAVTVNVCVQHMAFRARCACDGDVRGTCGGKGDKTVSKFFQKYLHHFKQFPIKWCQPRHLKKLKNNEK